MVIRMDRELSQELNQCAESATTTISVSSTTMPPQSNHPISPVESTRVRRRSSSSSIHKSHPAVKANRNTRAEFRRLKTIVPSIQRKDRVSKLDIILEAIKYIDDLQDQLFDRLGSPVGESFGESDQRMSTAQFARALSNCEALRGFGVSGPLHSDESEDEDDEDEAMSDDECVKVTEGLLPSTIMTGLPDSSTDPPSDDSGSLNGSL
ncbi:hypothetical protein TCAL_14578 [Tigriopus californicus]|uniref:BHLH domain-containing protein n=1 Tax=Tigriopus californicus TaxID=6832 RepID=A0A553PBJ1_TIGCA|nr:uncharacterized protein LOC131893639 [Tigriopus californicus]TRY75055.1 hypothetical protein TCAL_14578 [Tigriopus californicus]